MTVPTPAARSPRSLRDLAPRARLAVLADPGSLVLHDASRPSPHLGRFGIAPQDDDGIVTASLALAGVRVLAAAQDEHFLRGSIGQRHAEALDALVQRAVAEGADAVVLLLASGGVRLHEANAAELALAAALRRLTDARATGLRVLAVGVADVFGGASIVACAADRLALTSTARIGLSGPKVIETARGRAELDAGDRAAVDGLFGAAARAAAGQADLIPDDAGALREWIAAALVHSLSFAAQISRDHARIALRPEAPAPRGAPPLLAGHAAQPMDAQGMLWRLGAVAVTRPFTGVSFDGLAVHALDAALLEAAAVQTLIVTEDSAGHEVSRAAEARFESRRLAHHAAVLALLRARGVRQIGLLCGTGHSAAFFVNALQAPRLFAVPMARVIAMDPAAIARVTGRDVAQLIDDDPLLGQPVRHLAAHGGIEGLLAGADPLRALLATMAP